MLNAPGPRRVRGDRSLNARRAQRFRDDRSNRHASRRLRIQAVRTKFGGANAPATWSICTITGTGPAGLKRISDQSDCIPHVRNRRRERAGQSRGDQRRRFTTNPHRGIAGTGITQARYGPEARRSHPSSVPVPAICRHIPAIPRAWRCNNWHDAHNIAKFPPVTANWSA